MRLKYLKIKPGRYKTLLICALLAVLTAAVYWQVGGFELLSFDDAKCVTNNPHIKGFTIQNLRWAASGVINSNWQPVIWLSYMLDYQFFGLDAGAFHLVNLIIHIANTLLLLYLLKRMTGSLWKSAFVAAIFALHPLHVESVAWVAERKDVLSTLFWLLTMFAYIRYAEKPNLRRYIVVAVVFAFGLMAKPMLVTVPIILLLLDYWPLGRLKLKQPAPVSLKWLIVEKVPLVVMAMAVSVITLITQKAGFSTAEINPFPIGVRIANAIYCYVVYLRKILWPDDLAAFYPHPGSYLSPWVVADSAILIIVLTWLAACSRRKPYALVGWLWYLITLVPVIGLVQVGNQALADRYTYVPMIGIAVIIAWGIPDLLLKKQKNAKIGIAAFAAIIAITAITICTYRQAGYWENDITLFSHAVEVVPNNYLAHNNLGSKFYDQGDEAAAEMHFRKAIRIEPTDLFAYHNLVRLLYGQNRFNEAKKILRTTLKIYPDDGLAQIQLGSIYLQQSKPKLAEPHLRKAVSLHPKSATAHEYLGIALINNDKINEAIIQLSKAARLSPENTEIKTVLEYAKSLKKAQ
ncbi:tetratricopeptide repeat protein [bacterium]|nr:tetratricopeptide repeat protein [bacterium]